MPTDDDILRDALTRLSPPVDTAEGRRALARRLRRGRAVAATTIAVVAVVGAAAGVTVSRRSSSPSVNVPATQSTVAPNTTAAALPTVAPASVPVVECPTTYAITGAARRPFSTRTLSTSIAASV